METMLRAAMLTEMCFVVVLWCSIENYLLILSYLSRGEEKNEIFCEVSIIFTNYEDILNIIVLKYKN